MKINSKQANNFNLKLEALKSLEESIGTKLYSIGIGKKFLVWTLIAQEPRIRKLDYMKFMFLHCKGSQQQTEQKTTYKMEENQPVMLQAEILLSKIYKEQQKKVQKTKLPVRKQASRLFFKEKMQMANKYFKKVFIVLCHCGNFSSIQCYPCEISCLLFVFLCAIIS